ncbi:MAG TPA: phosphate ABC transporter permease PtsA, partial [Burkholderiales bacterium]|nr:phosphate ABC transporter permease PtsA [Burkholderiales bacterium]
MNLYTWRRIVNGFSLGISLLAMLFGLFWLGWILVTLVSAGSGALGLHLFTETTPPPGSAGGLANAIAGSVLMALGGTL